jgi:hypothetical protein
MPKGVGYGGTKTMKAVGKVSKGRNGTAAGKAANPPKKITAGKQGSSVGGKTRSTTGAVVSKGSGTTKGASLLRPRRSPPERGSLPRLLR